MISGLSETDRWAHTGKQPGPFEVEFKALKATCLHLFGQDLLQALLDHIKLPRLINSSGMGKTTCFGFCTGPVSQQGLSILLCSPPDFFVLGHGRKRMSFVYVLDEHCMARVFMLVICFALVINFVHEPVAIDRRPIVCQPLV